MLVGSLLKPQISASVLATPVAVTVTVDALAPLAMALVPKLAVPLATVCVVVEGKSAVAMARKPTAPEEPFGVARNSLAVCDPAAVTASVPEEVTGEPDTVSLEGTDIPTEVTVPPPLPDAGDQLPSPRR